MIAEDPRQEEDSRQGFEDLFAAVEEQKGVTCPGCSCHLKHPHSPDCPWKELQKRVGTMIERLREARAGRKAAEAQLAVQPWRRSKSRDSRVSAAPPVTVVPKRGKCPDCGRYFVEGHLSTCKFWSDSEASR